MSTPLPATFEIRSQLLEQGDSSKPSRVRFWVAKIQDGKETPVDRPVIRVRAVNDDTLTNSTNGTIAAITNRGDVVVTTTANKDLTFQAEVGRDSIDIALTNETADRVQLLAFGGEVGGYPTPPHLHYIDHEVISLRWTLSFSAVNGATACGISPATDFYTAPADTALEAGVALFDDALLTTPAGEGFYSDESDYWSVDGDGEIDGTGSCA